MPNKYRCRGGSAKAFCLALSVGGSVLFQSVGAQASNLYDNLSTCTGINCEALSLQGTIFTHNAPPSVMPWQAMVYAGQGQCLRLHTTSASPPEVSLFLQALSPRGERY